MIKPGDKVRFLDATGGGTVVRVDEARQLAYVEDNDGFEVPTTFSQCVVVPQEEQEYRVKNRSAQKAVAQKETSKPTAQREASSGKKEAKQEDLLEVDLHIEALLPNASSMPQNEMLQYQLRVATKVMGEHLRHKGKKIVFIHGRGEGRLKQELHHMLSRQFSTCLFLEASYQKYGSGATMVIIN